MNRLLLAALVLTAVAAGAFYAELRSLPWRIASRVVLVGVLAGLVAFYRPT